MIDLGSVKYCGAVITEGGVIMELTDYMSDLTWQEAKGQLSMKATFTARNDKTGDKFLSDIVKPGMVFIVLATLGGETREVFRGKIEVWNPVSNGDNDTLKCTAYDDLFPLQKSQDNYTVKKNTRAGKALRKFFKEWDLTIGRYEGPTVKLKKMIFQSKTVADIANGILQKAYDMGDDKCFMRAEDGVIDILPYCDNYDIYFFGEDIASEIDERQSTENLVTRVKIMDKENKKMKAKVDGLTEYGIRQKMKVMQQDEKLQDAKTEAQQIIDEQGKPERSITVKSPDLPFLRKGDAVYIDIRTSVGYFDVVGVTHDAEDGSMTMNLEFSSLNDISGSSGKRKSKYRKGDIVTFYGGEYHISAKSGSRTFSAPSGRATIKSIKKKAAYPYRLVHSGSSSTVNGYVSEDQFY